MSVTTFFTVTPGTEPNTLVVQGTIGRYADMRAVWLEETPGHLVALDKTGAPIADPHNPAQRVLVTEDGPAWLMGMFTSKATRFAGQDRDAALAKATTELHS